MRYTTLTTVLIILFCIAGLVACGGGSKSVTPPPPPPPTLSSITVTGAATTVTAGLTVQMAATGHYSDNTTKDLTSTVTWSSSDTNIATVSAAGLVTGVKAGSATISAASGAKSGNMAMTVAAAPVVLNSIALTASKTTIPMGATQQIVATGNYSDGSTADLSGSVTWASSNTAAFDVDSTGLATAKATSGTSDITASSNGVTSPKITLTAAAVAEKAIMFVPSSISLAKYQFVKPYIYLVYTDNSVEDVTPSSLMSVDDAGVVNLVGTNAGYLTGKAPGTTKLRATYNSGVGQLATVANVTVAGTVTSVTLAPKNPTVHQGGEVLFAITGNFDTGGSQVPMKFVSWNVDNTAVADFKGPVNDTLNGLTAGTTTVRGNLGGQEDTATLTVDDYTMDSLSITPASPISMARNVTMQLTATAHFKNAANVEDTLVLRNVAWSSSDPTVATVNANGLITSKHISAPGSTVITAMLPNGMSQTVTVNVAAATLDHLEVTSDNASPKVGDVVHFKATAFVTDGRQFDVTPIAIWQSSDGSLALIDATGKFTALKAGTVTLTTFYANPVTTNVTIAP